MPETELSLRNFQGLVIRAREASAKAISGDATNTQPFEIDGVAVLNLGFYDESLRRGLTYQTLVLATSYTWTDLFFTVLSTVTFNEAGITLAHARDVLRPEGVNYDFHRWREEIQNGKRMPGYKVFLAGH